MTFTVLLRSRMSWWTESSSLRLSRWSLCRLTNWFTWLTSTKNTSKKKFMREKPRNSIRRLSTQPLCIWAGTLAKTRLRWTESLRLKRPTSTRTGSLVSLQKSNLSLATLQRSMSLPTRLNQCLKHSRKWTSMERDHRKQKHSFPCANSGANWDSKVPTKLRKSRRRKKIWSKNSRRWFTRLRKKWKRWNYPVKWEKFWMLSTCSLGKMTSTILRLSFRSLTQMARALLSFMSSKSSFPIWECKLGRKREKTHHRANFWQKTICKNFLKPWTRTRIENWIWRNSVFMLWGQRRMTSTFWTTSMKKPQKK